MNKDKQLINEYLFVEKNIKNKLGEMIDSDLVMQAKIQEGIELLSQWNVLEGLDLRQLVREVYIQGICCIQETMIVHVACLVAKSLNFSDKPEAIKVAAEVLGILKGVGIYDIRKRSKYSPMMVISCVEVTGLEEDLDLAQYPMPMMCKPQTVKNNWMSGYLTFNESNILGRGNDHHEEICLDVLNKLNKQALRLDWTVLRGKVEVPKEIPTDSNSKANWAKFVKDSQTVYEILGNEEFYLCWQVDVRGRLYCKGYHVNCQAGEYKKASINVKPERLEGL